MNETTTPTPTIDDRRDALRWLIDNRREEVSIEDGHQNATLCITQ